ncbi:hypothetical protein MTO96_043261 [Rhipicephalus appendiculatus]
MQPTRIPAAKEDAGPTAEAKPELNLEEIARLELGETPATKAESLLQLRQLLEKEATLKIPSSDDFLVMFLRARKYRVEDAFKMIKNYFRVRRDIPEFFDNLVIEKVPFRKVCLEHNLLLISPEPGEYGRCMVFFNIGAWNAHMCSFVDFTRAVLLLAASWLLEDHPSICGAVVVMDMKGLNIHHLMHITPSYLVKVAHIAQVHLMGPESPEFWDHFPRDVVPSEHGGRREHFDYDRQEEFVRSKSTFLESMCTCGYKKK